MTATVLHTLEQMNRALLTLEALAEAIKAMSPGSSASYLAALAFKEINAVADGLAELRDGLEVSA